MYIYICIYICVVVYAKGIMYPDMCVLAIKMRICIDDLVVSESKLWVTHSYIRCGYSNGVLTNMARECV